MGLALVLACSASVSPSASAEEAEFQIEADELHYERGTQVVSAVGDVRLSSGSLLVRAPAAEFDRARRLGSAGGGVLAVDGLRLLSARTLEFDLEARTVVLDDGQVLVKREVSAEVLHELVAGDAPERALRAGRNALSLSAKRIVERADRSYGAEGVRLTTCDCGEGCPPLLGFSSPYATVTPGDLAVLWLPVLRVFGLPVLPLPALVFPLTDRKSGLLIPRVQVSGPGGFAVEQPLFLTLGRSADLTLSGSRFFGPENPQLAGRGVEGWGSSGELRWRPAEEAQGALRVGHVFDRMPLSAGQPERRGHRFEGSASHGQPLGGGWLALRSALASDSRVFFDTEPMIVRSEIPYLRSAIAYSRPFSLLGVGGGGAVETLAVQSLQSGPGGERVRLEESPGVITPLGRGWLHGQGRTGPLALNGTLSLSREAAPGGLVVAEGRSGRALLGLRAGQVLPVFTGAFGEVALEAGQRLDLLSPAGAILGGSVPAGAPEGGARWGGFAGLRAATAVERAFQGGWRHRVAPSLRVRGFASGGDVPFRDDPFAVRALAPQSSLDVALPAVRAAQVLTRVGTSLSRPGWALLQLGVEHHLGLEEERATAPGEEPLPATTSQVRFFADTGLPARFGELRLRGDAAVDTVAAELARLRGELFGSLSGATAAFSASYVGRVVDDRFGQGPDMLFATSAGQRASGGNRLVVLNGSMGVPLARDLRVELMVDASWPLDRPDVAPVRQYAARLTYAIPGCATFSGALAWNPDSRDPPLVDLRFQLGELRAPELAARPSLAAPEAERPSAIGTH